MTSPTLRLAGTLAGARLPRHEPANESLCNMNEAAFELGISVRSLERALRDPGSAVPRPFRVRPGPCSKRLFRREDLRAYVAGMALLARATTPR